MKIKALTLVEVIISMVILSLLAAGLTKVFISSDQWLFHGRAQMAGAGLGKVFLDPLQFDVSQASWDGVGNRLNIGVGPPGARTLNTIAYSANYVVSPVAGLPAGRLRKVVATISWFPGGEPKF